MSEIYKWRIYCITEGKFVYHYGPIAPTVCPNDSNHEVNPGSISMIEKISPDKMIVEDDVPDKGIFQVKTIVIDIPQTVSVPSVIPIYKTYPFDAYIREISIKTDSLNVGDSLDVEFGHDTPIAVATTELLSGTTVLNVSPQIFPFIYRGSEIGIASLDESPNEYPGVVIDYDEKEGTITVETPLTKTYPIGSTILFSNYAIRGYVFDSSERHDVGGKGLRSTFVPRGTPVRIIYTDNTISNSATKAFIHLQYYMK